MCGSDGELLFHKPTKMT